MKSLSILARIKFSIATNIRRKITAQKPKFLYLEALPSRSVRRHFILSSAAREQRRQLPLQKRTHPFYIAPYAEYPLLVVVGLGGLLFETVNYFHEGMVSSFFNYFLIVFTGSVFFWLADLSKLRKIIAQFTKIVETSLETGVVLFIISETMAFMGLFWAYLHSSLNPSEELGAIWPPFGIQVLKGSLWPAFSTILLVYSGITINGFYDRLELLLAPSNSGAELNSQTAKDLWLKSQNSFEITFLGTAEEFTQFSRPAHLGYGGPVGMALGLYRYMALRQILFGLYGSLVLTITIGTTFSFCQRHEYQHAGYSMDDGVYASVFYGLTGLHGIHVIVGLLLLLGLLGRFWGGAFAYSVKPYVSATAAYGYGHFVDAVGILVFGIVYLWGNAKTNYIIG